MVVVVVVGYVIRLVRLCLLSFVSLLLFDKLGVLYVCWLLSTKFMVIYSWRLAIFTRSDVILRAMWATRMRHCMMHRGASSPTWSGRCMSKNLKTK